MAGGSEWPCYTVISGKVWVMLHEDPLASGQRWYCNVCLSKYRPKFGVLVEFHVLKDVYFLLAEYPKQWNDTKHMNVEATVVASTPKELYDNILDVKPYTGCGSLTPAPRNEIRHGDGSGVFRFSDPEAVKRMPAWNWNDLADVTKVLTA